MRLGLKICQAYIFVCLFAGLCTLNAVEQKAEQLITPKKSDASTPSSLIGDPVLDKNLTLSAISTRAWLELVDKERYGESWDEGSKLLQETVKRKEWVKILNKTRQPLGAVKSRSVLDQRTAKNPKNMPAGDYMVMFYNTSFANKPLAYELVTLHLEPDGQWKVITYNVN